MKSFKLDDGELFYQDAGDGPGLLLLHAGIADSRMWEGQVAAFAQEYRVLRPDLRGYGRSLLPDGRFSYHEDVLALVEGLELSPTWLVGASFGARVAVDFTLAYPQHVKGLVLVAPVVSGYRPAGMVTQFNMKEDAALAAGELEEATELNMRMWVDGPFRASDEVDGALRARVAEMQLAAFRQPVPENASVKGLEPPAIERLHEIQVPSLVISGALDVPAFSQLAGSLVERVPGASLAVVPEVAHLPSMEAPERFNRLLLNFIEGAAVD